MHASQQRLAITPTASWHALTATSRLNNDCDFGNFLHTYSTVTDMVWQRYESKQVALVIIMLIFTCRHSVKLKWQKHRTGGIPRWPPTLVLIARLSACSWQSGRSTVLSPSHLLCARFSNKSQVWRGSGTVLILTPTSKITASQLLALYPV
jgi:hypothetical protein